MTTAMRSLWSSGLGGIVLFLTGLINTSGGQVVSGSITGSSLNQIPVAVPFLTIAPDGRAAGMGDAGAASAPDPNAQHWNAAKYVFLEGRGGVALTYTPWIPELLPDIALIYTAGGYRINEKNALSGSFRYFNLGTFLQGYHPREWALDAGYSRKFTDHLSGGIVLRYIRSDLTDAPDSQAGTSIAGDLGIYYQKGFMIGVREARWATGMSLSNLGSTVSYSADDEGIPIPSNLRIGGRFGIDLNRDHAIDFHLDFNKLLVPTPPVYGQDPLTGERFIIRGKAPPQSVVRGMIQSFYDAPGVLKESGEYSVLSEEIHEITAGTGLEYTFRNMLAVRTGYFHEHAAKGNRKYLTFGAGAGFRFLSMDVSYLLPVDHNAYLKNTFRVTLKALF